MAFNNFQAKAVAILSAITLSLASAVGIPDAFAAKIENREICVSKSTKELKLRKKCKADEQFLASAESLLSGGKSAYEIWLDLGNTGTESQFINSLRGASARTPNPFSGQSCTSAMGYAEQKIGKRIFFKETWEYLEANTDCEIDQTQLFADPFNPSFNSVLDLLTVEVASPSSIEVTRYSNRPPAYKVLVNLDVSFDLPDDWIVCDTSTPTYLDADFAEPEEYVVWEDFEAGLSGDVYRLQTYAYVRGSGISFEISDLASGDVWPLSRLPLCRENALTETGWEKYTFEWQAGLPYLPHGNPEKFTGLGIHYISEWGWE